MLLEVACFENGALLGPASAWLGMKIRRKIRHDADNDDVAYDASSPAPTGLQPRSTMPHRATQ
jgi:hypothetical protein